MTTPEEGITAGSLFGYGPQADLNELWTKDQGTFSLGLDGDNIFLFCLDSMNKIRFLSAFTNAGAWKPPNLHSLEYGHNTSALPETLVDSEVAVSNRLNYHYAGPRDARINLLRRSILDPEEWAGSNEVRFRMGNVEPIYASSTLPVAPSRTTFFCSVLSYLLVWVLT
jgi:hypothetical protein